MQEGVELATAAGKRPKSLSLRGRTERIGAFGGQFCRAKPKGPQIAGSFEFAGRTQRIQAFLVRFAAKLPQNGAWGSKKAQYFETAPRTQRMAAEKRAGAAELRAETEKKRADAAEKSIATLRSQLAASPARAQAGDLMQEQLALMGRMHALGRPIRATCCAER